MRADRARGGGDADMISLFTLGSALLVHRWRIVRWALLGGLLAAFTALLQGPSWTASASFILHGEGAEGARTGLRSLAGQFGVVIPGGTVSPTHSPEFYADLLASPVILGPIVDDSLVVVEEGDQRRAVLDLLEVTARDPRRQREKGIEALRESMRTSVARTTGVLTIAVKSAWPSVSLAITERLMKEVNYFNLRTLQSQAAEERRFVEGRLASQRQSLVEAEGRLGAFLQANRQFQNSPSLTFEFERLQREVELQQQVLVGLAQAYEEARIREVRDVPVITQIEAPDLPARPDPRGRLLRGLLGMLLGGFLGVILAFAGEVYDRRRAYGDEEAARFTALLGDARRDLTRWMRRGAGAERGVR